MHSVHVLPESAEAWVDREKRSKTEKAMRETVEILEWLDNCPTWLGLVSVLSFLPKKSVAAASAVLNAITKRSKNTDIYKLSCEWRPIDSLCIVVP
jgi:hypothetical protein